MKISVFGAGYVGLVVGACLADVGNDVLCVDLDKEKISTLIAGRSPIFEPGLEELLRHNLGEGRLRFTTDVQAGALHGSIQFIAVGTPSSGDGSADLQGVLDTAQNIGKHMDGMRIIVNKSTVPVGTAEKVLGVISAELASRGEKIPFHVVSNPEFLKEGAAIGDFMRPERIVLGVDSDEALEFMRRLYAPFERNHDKIIVMEPRSAELTKYASNAMLATRISFMNQIALLAMEVGADVDAVRRGMGSDPRIGQSFLYAGCGYGGSCFPKDVKALMRTASDHGLRLSILEAVESANQNQKRLIVDMIRRRFGEDLRRHVFAVWGLSFKPNTDDVREAPSLVMIRELLQLGATLRVFDPVANKAAESAIGNSPRISYWPRAMDVIEGVDALIVVTEWKEFRSPDFERIKATMRQAIIFDGRNIYEPKILRRLGFEYSGIGRR